MRAFLAYAKWRRNLEGDPSDGEWLRSPAAAPIILASSGVEIVQVPVCSAGVGSRHSASQGENFPFAAHRRFEQRGITRPQRQRYLIIRLRRNHSKVVECVPRPVVPRWRRPLHRIPANETGLPAISVLAGLDSDGLPIGVQFYGNFTGEDLLLRLAVQLEQARPEWFGIRPGVHVAA